MKAALIYSNFLDYEGNELMIGGVETYLFNLANVCQEMGVKPVIYQWARQSFEKNVDGIMVKGIGVLRLRYKQRTPALFLSALKELVPERDIIIFGSDSQSVHCSYKRAVSIQHGISWDLPVRFLSSHRLCQSERIGKLYKLWVRWRFLKYYQQCPNHVCVDYNFLNWYRTYLVSDPPGKIWVIPNFTAIATKEQLKLRDRNYRMKKIIFARRFCDYRGTRMIAEAAKMILAKYSDIEFAFAGAGPDEKWLKEYFAREPRVKFIKYSMNKVLEVHLQYDIAVIPSLGSEGTSLSVAEAMGAGCAIVATNIGGITNMIIDGYNGLLVNPKVDELSLALSHIIQNPTLMKDLSSNAYDVACKSFAIDRWRDQWRKVIQELAGI
jgi:glycosyltransferase involved in cell wall biosynthesis